MTKKNHPYGPDCLEEHENAYCMEMGRRSFLKTTGVTLAGLGLPLSFASCEEAPVMLKKPSRPLGTATVGITRKNDIEDAVRTAIELAGGLGDIASGDTVVIKPNITGPEMRLPARIFTHPEVLRAVIRAVKDRTSSTNITVAEAAAFNLPTTLWARNVGIYQVCEEEGVNFMAWETENYITTFSEDFEHVDFNLRFPLSLFDGSFDHFINVPILKNHDMCANTNVDYTCCIKNHVGVLNPMDRMFGGETVSDGTLLTRPITNMGIHKATLGDVCAELNLAVPKHTMNVVDALSVILTGGPAAIDMDSADSGLILACKDRVACDSLAVAVLKLYAKEQNIDMPYVNKSVWEQAQIVRAQQLNLGRTKDKITIAHEDVDNIDDILAQWV